MPARPRRAQFSPSAPSRQRSRATAATSEFHNRLPLTLEGVIASLRLSLEPDKAKRGDRTTAAVTLDAYDASGAEIVGPSDYSDPIVLAIQGDANKSFLLHDGDRSAQSLTIRKPSSGITLTYDGNKQASPITVVGSVSETADPARARASISPESSLRRR